MSPSDGHELPEPVDPGVERVARAMTAHPVPDLAARVRARLAQPTLAPRLGLGPLWAAAALAGIVVLGLRLAPGPEPAVAPAPTTVAQSAAPALPVPARGAVDLSPAPKRTPSGSGAGVNPLPVPWGLRGKRSSSAPKPPSVRRTLAATAPAPPVTPAEPWPGDELDAWPLRYEPLAAPPLALDAIGLDPLARAEPLTIEAAAGPADGAARPGEEETQ